MRVQIRYFASLREKRAVSEESRETKSETPEELYRELQEAFGLPLPWACLRVAVNGEFAEGGRLLQDGDEVTFIPPVAGG